MAVGGKDWKWETENQHNIFLNESSERFSAGTGYSLWVEL